MTQPGQSTPSTPDDKGSFVHEEGIQPSLAPLPTEIHKPRVEGGDKGAAVLAEVTERVVVSPEEDRRVLRLVD